MSIVARTAKKLMWVATLVAHACAPVQITSEQSLENKLANVKLGVTGKAEIENLFGREHGPESLRWIYNLSGSSANTRALITVRFSDKGTVNGLEAARYFDSPFINDYWYLIEGKPENILELAARVGEANNFRAVGFDKSASSFALEDGATKARITVKLGNNILQIRSNNPHDRLANEYRVFTKREGLFMEKLLAALAKPDTFTKNDTFTKTNTATPSAPSPPAKKTANLSWNNNSSNAEGFRVYRITGKQKTKIAELESNVTAYVDKDAPPKACYVVTAFNAAGESPATSQVCLPD
jgi:hypothetical protein